MTSTSTMLKAPRCAVLLRREPFAITRMPRSSHVVVERSFTHSPPGGLATIPQALLRIQLSRPARGYTVTSPLEGRLSRTAAKHRHEAEL
jgi:hypothetical protein